jgi:hypothetical protein
LPPKDMRLIIAARHASEQTRRDAVLIALSRCASAGAI